MKRLSARPWTWLEGLFTFSFKRSLEPKAIWPPLLSFKPRKSKKHKEMELKKRGARRQVETKNHTGYRHWEAAKPLAGYFLRGIQAHFPTLGARTLNEIQILWAISRQKAGKNRYEDALGATKQLGKYSTTSDYQNKHTND
jgi:hypothetical protein